MTALSKYLAEASSRRWQPGVFDCSVFMADWVVRLCERDPIADVRGTYTTERQFCRILRKEGGFLVSCATRLSSVGFRETNAPKPGDLVVVLAPYSRQDKTARRPIGAIAASETHRAVITSDAGLVITDDRVLPLVKGFTYG